MIYVDFHTHISLPFFPLPFIIWGAVSISGQGTRISEGMCHQSVSSVAQSCPTLCDPWTAACQASLSITNSQSLLKLMSIESVMPSNHLILCLPLLLPPSIFPSIRVFPNESVLHIRWPKCAPPKKKRHSQEPDHVGARR